MKISLPKQASFLVVTMMLISSVAATVKAQVEPENPLVAQRAIRRTTDFKGEKPPSISAAGTVNSRGDHYFDILVRGEALNRLRVLCVTFHELDEVKIINQSSGQEIPYTINYGFEEFIVTFEESVTPGETVRVVIEGATVPRVNTGTLVPYRVFGESDAFGEIPLGTALVRTLAEN